MGETEPVSLLQREPGEWIVCFVPAIDRQWWHRYLPSKMKHCYALKPEGVDRWLIFEPWWSRLLLAVATDEEAKVFLAWGRRGKMLRVREHVPGRSSQMRVWMSCAALVAHLLGRNYWVWTPKQLYERLRKEPGVTDVA
jgi:hypothetical protein